MHINKLTGISFFSLKKKKEIQAPIYVIIFKKVFKLNFFRSLLPIVSEEFQGIPMQWNTDGCQMDN